MPAEGPHVFYRFFRDRISWFEADAVCQFHHANLVTGKKQGHVNFLYFLPLVSCQSFIEKLVEYHMHNINGQFPLHAPPK